ncbi:MAG TPA: site-2 protease family protein [Alphaproteobacteria bacterium]|nr:site-2 protease family protein [Alphaproteobacteria bacterium]
MAREGTARGDPSAKDAWRGHRFTLFSLFGFKVRVDISLLFLALLVTWSLASAVFPPQLPGLDRATYWWMGVAGTIGLFFSLIFHELSHSLVARRYGLPIRGITLFIFGGVAEMSDEPPSAKAEFWMALAGPAASILLALLAWALSSLGAAAGLPEPVTAVVAYLALINAILAVFNLVPAYPLDGGRVLRAALWWRKGDIVAATRSAARAGGAFALLLMGLGVLQVVTGNFVGGIWFFLIGMFLRSAARGSYMDILTRGMLAGAPVRRFMTRDPVTVPPGITLQALVEDYVYAHHHEQFPVVDGERLIGSVGVRQLKATPRESWPHRTVAEIAEPSSDANTVDAETDAAKALSLMTRSGRGRLLVTERGRLVGILALKDLLAILSLKIELEGQTP